MEICQTGLTPRSIQCAVFDFDGTISTLRCGWEQVMQPLMEEVLLACPAAPAQAEVRRTVAAFIDESTGIQTIYQMKWLAQQVEKYGGVPLDAWDYKAEYNTRLMKRVQALKARLAAGKEPAENYLIAGAAAFLQALRDRGVGIYVASGTDHPDVLQEAAALDVQGLVDEIAGAPLHEEACSKEAVLRRLVAGLPGGQVAVFGDGKVEISLAKEVGALAVGIASNESARRGMDEAKRRRLLAAGADVITGDFTDQAGLLRLMGLE